MVPFDRYDIRLPIRLPKQLFAYLMPFQRSGVRKKYGLNKQKLAARATYLERSQPNFTTIIYARRATNPQNLAKIAQVLSEVIGLEPIITRSSAIADGSRDASCQ